MASMTDAAPKTGPGRGSGGPPAGGARNAAQVVVRSALRVAEMPSHAACLPDQGARNPRRVAQAAPNGRTVSYLEAPEPRLERAVTGAARAVQRPRRRRAANSYMDGSCAVTIQARAMLAKDKRCRFGTRGTTSTDDGEQSVPSSFSRVPIGESQMHRSRSFALLLRAAL
jgi:hypothetical protein